MKENTTSTLIFAALALLAIVGCAILVGLTGITFTWGSDGLKIHNPQADARALAQLQRTSDEAARQALERQAEEKSLPGKVMGRLMLYIALGTGGLILIVGVAFGLVAWVNKRAMSVYPNNAGQYPVIIKRSLGGVTIVHDPNRAVGPTTVYTTPSFPAIAAKMLGLHVGEPGVQAPLNASETTHGKITTQAQAVGLMSAATRPQGWKGLVVNEHFHREKEDDRLDLARSLLAGGPTSPHELPPTQVLLGGEADEMRLLVADAIEGEVQ